MLLLALAVCTWSSGPPSVCIFFLASVPMLQFVWDARPYWRLYKRCFGVSLEKAEWQWHSELQLMDVLNRRRKSCQDI